MGNKEVARNLLLAVATAGLTTCGGGSVDPAPEPLHCPDVSQGQSLNITGSVEGNKLVMFLTDGNFNSLEPGWQVTAGVGLTIDGFTELTDKVRIDATLDAGATAGSFSVTGEITDGEVTCEVTRTFTATVTDGQVEVTLRDDLPISPRRHAAIQMLGREGLEVDLAASGAGTAAVVWTPTGGAITASSDGRARWTLPTEPGVYQVEMLVDHGESGFTLDTLTLEVLG